MEAENNLRLLLENPTLSADLKQVAEKVLNSVRITFDEGVLLFEKGELPFVGALAAHIANRLHGNKVYFNRNFHIEPTNVCIYTCNFCSYSKLYAHREEGWEFTKEQMMDMMAKTDRQPGTGAFPGEFKLRAVYGNVALASDHTIIKGGDSNGKIVVTREMGVLRMFVKENGKWRVAGAGLVPIVPGPAPASGPSSKK